MKANVILKNKKFRFYKHTSNPTIGVKPPQALLAWGPEPLVALKKSWTQYNWTYYQSFDWNLGTFECRLKEGNETWVASYRCNYEA